MRNTLLLITLFFVAAQLFGQQVKDSTLTKDYYLAKSKKSKSTAWILLGTGAGLTTIGVLVIHETSTRQDDVKEIGLVGLSAIVAGTVMMVISVPYFTDAKTNKKRAASITMSHQRIHLPVTGSNAINVQPTITLRIGL